MTFRFDYAPGAFKYRNNKTMFTTRVLVCGGRKYPNGSLVFTELNEAEAYYGDIIVIQGGATGADEFAKQWALSKGLCCLEVPAAWDTYNSSAGKIRNGWMLKFAAPHIVMAFPGGAGTEDMCKQAGAAGIPVYRMGK